MIPSSPHTADSSVIDQRRRERTPLRASARLWLESGWQDLACHDLSTGGIGLELPDPTHGDLIILPRPCSAPVRVTVALEGGEIELAAQVVRRRGRRIGLRLMCASHAVERRLAALIAAAQAA